MLLTIEIPEESDYHIWLDIVVQIKEQHKKKFKK